MSDQSLKKRRILLVDDEPELRRMVATMLAAEGFSHVVQAANVQEALAAYRQAKPELALLDVMLPDGDGFTLCQYLRAFDPDTPLPVIFLTAKDETDDRLAGLRCGADDYVTKPFDSTELLLRIEANIRRHKDTIDFARCRNREGVARIGELEVRFGEYEVRVKGRPVALTTKEFEIVAFLAAHPGKVFTRSQIQEYIWGESDADCKPTNNITVFVRKIREKIEENPSEPKYLLTVQRVGYKMADTLE